MKNDKVTQVQQSTAGVNAGCCCSGSKHAANDTDHQSVAVAQPSAKPETPAKSGGGCCGHN